jgi:hypothetical protein
VPDLAAALVGRPAVTKNLAAPKEAPTPAKNVLRGGAP